MGKGHSRVIVFVRTKEERKWARQWNDNRMIFNHPDKHGFDHPNPSKGKVKTPSYERKG